MSVICYNGFNMQLKVVVNSVAYDTEYGGEQIIPARKGEYVLDEIFRLHFFRIAVDDVIDGALCFRLMEGAVPHFFVLDRETPRADFRRETGIGGDDFTFELI